MSDPRFHHRSREVWFAWAQLVRLPNAFTVMADVLAGAMLSRGSWQPGPLLLTLVMATLAMYWAGMILNDLYDLEKDRLQDRRRPLVDGRIRPSSARVAGYGLLIAAIVAVIVVTLIYARQFDSNPASPVFWGIASSTPLIAILLALSIWLYDGPLKATSIGPLLMGICRVGSLLIGISIGWWLAPVQPWSRPHFWMAAIGHGVYVMGITWAARREAEERQTWTLALGWSICCVGIAMLASVSWFAPIGIPMRLDPRVGYPIAIGLLALPWARRAAISVATPRPVTIQAAVKQAILSLIFFDAILTLQFGGTWPAIIVCSFILPAMMLGKFFKST